MPPIEWHDLASIGQLLASFVTVIIAALVFFTARRIARLEEYRYLTDQRQAFNRLGLESEHIPDVVRAVFGHNATDIDIRKSNYRGTMQNMAYSYYLAQKEGYIEARVAEGYLDYLALCLKPLQDDMKYLERIYGTEFADDLRKRMK